MTKQQKKFLKASWPAFGGKSAIAGLVWERFDKPDNMIEPFCNSAAMMLKNPNGEAHYETINDLNCYVANYWRSVKMAPDLVAEHSDWPVSETDLHARHRWLIASPEAATFREKMLADPKYYDPMFAGWWAWGNSLWIGSGWCQKLTQQIPYLMTGGMGVCSEGSGSKAKGQRPELYACRGMNNPRPQLADVHSRGRGVHANDSVNTCEERRLWLREWMQVLSDRFRNVRVCCSDWKRVCASPSVTTRLGMTAVFLDPPYRTHVEGKESRKGGLYSTDKGSDLDQIQKDVLAYGLKHGPNPQMRIAICALEGEGYEPLVEAGWEEVAWSSKGYGMRSEKGKLNAARERVWFSPSCVIFERDLYPLFGDQDEISS